LIAPETIASFVSLAPPALLIKKVEDPPRYGVVSQKAARSAPGFMLFKKRNN
jgi:dTDP-glucose pyrophosphorylase